MAIGITILLDPRAPGGTSSAVAQELAVLDEMARVRIAGLETAMFRDRPIHAGLEKGAARLGIDLDWISGVVADDVVVFHNPAFLKFETEALPRVSCDVGVVVTHENFVAPSGRENFDVGHTLGLLDAAFLARRTMLAPVSAYNRSTVQSWLNRTQNTLGFEMAVSDWPNICEFEMKDPNPAPQDRRGRHSRAGFEKFASPADMEAMFPPSCAHVGILGGDHFVDDHPPHWTVFRFGTLDVTQFLAEIDFFVYFTNPNWRESFGRVIAEAVAAGKVVLTDPETASTFGDHVIGCAPGEVDGHVARLIANPAGYARLVRGAQADLGAFSREAFAGNVTRILELPGISQ